jgi:hypothetical protein
MDSERKAQLSAYLLTVTGAGHGPAISGRLSRCENDPPFLNFSYQAIQHDGLPRQALDECREEKTGNIMVADFCIRYSCRGPCDPLREARARSGQKRVPLFAMPFIYKMHHFTKTGSGQT